MFAYHLYMFRLGFLLLATIAINAQPASLTDRRPPIKLTTSEAFDASKIAPYRGEHAKVYAYIDGHQPQHVAALQRWLRQPSISAQNVGIAEMAAMVRDDLKSLGCQETEIVPTAGHPGVFGWYDAGAKKTLVVYMMYDVQPVEPEAWQVKPFDGAIVDGPLGKAIVARGAQNQKGPERSSTRSSRSSPRTGSCRSISSSSSKERRSSALRTCPTSSGSTSRASRPPIRSASSFPC
jgi:hypothetical protein